MLIDFQAEGDIGRLEADIVIVGSGPAGMTVALQFLDTNTRVILLEGGGLEYTDESQALYEGAIGALPYFSMRDSRLRYLGGSSNHWSGRCLPLDREDFERKSYVRYSGWPIARSDLDPYLVAAGTILELGRPTYDFAKIGYPEALVPPVDPAKLVLKIKRHSPPTRFNERYLKPLEASQNVHVVYNANATNLRLSADLSHVEAVTVRNYGDAAMEVSGRFVVVALGGIENSRFLLNCRDQMTSGIGNANDLVGRFWMEHPRVEAASIIGGRGVEQLKLFTVQEESYDGDVELWNIFATSPELQQQQGVLPCSFVVSQRPPGLASPGYAALGEIWEHLREQELSQIDVHVASLFGDLGGAIAGVSEKLGVVERDTNGSFVVIASCEQEANPESRIRLTDAKDRFGHNRASLDWRLTDFDLRTIRVATLTLAEELARLDIGRMKLRGWLADEQTPTWPSGLQGGYHHLGGTRMSESAKLGVVDRDCKVHGMENLYIAGSSVFPTGGIANPTLTIVQLALRLSDHLKSRVASPSDAQ